MEDHEFEANLGYTVSKEKNSIFENEIIIYTFSYKINVKARLGNNIRVIVIFRIKIREKS